MTVITPRDSVAAPGAPTDWTPPSPADRAYRILLETARQLGGSLEPSAIFARLKHSVCGAVRCDGLIVSAFDRASGVIRCDYAWTGGNVLDPATLPPLIYREDSGGMQSQVIRTGRPAMFSDVVERVRDPKGTYYEVDRGGEVRDLKEGGPPTVHSAIMVPLRLEGEVVGVIQVMADAQNAYTATDLELLEGISLLLAVALENARLYRRAQDELEERRRAERELLSTEQALREADRRKDEFIATLGHELRNPLNPIRNAVELLRRKGTTDPDVRWGHDIIQRQVIHLTRLMDDLLDVSRITQGKLDLRRVTVDLDDLLTGAVESVRPLVESSEQRLTLHPAPEPVRLDADPVRLAQLFSNLIDNAAKYTSRGGRIEVSSERRGDRVAVSIRDDGAGIRTEDLPHIFDLFYQVERSSGRLHGGLGIGLTLVKRLVELHGGTIEAFSEGPGLGSRFVVTLPVHAGAEAAARVPDAAPPRAARSMRILIADDHRDSANSMAMLMRMGGHEVAVAYDGEEAVRMAEDARPDVVLLDIGMPRLNGYEVAQRLRTQPRGRELVLIATTGWGQEEDRRRSARSGFDAHLVKPVDHQALLEVLVQLSTLRGIR